MTALAKSHALQANEHYTLETISDMRREFTRDAMERALHARVQTIFRQEKASFIELGLILLEVDTQRLWESPGFHSMAEWIQDVAPVSDRTCYSALKVARNCASVPVEELKQINRCNISALADMDPKDQVRPKILTAAKTLSERGFKELRKAELPEKHYETDSPMRFKPTESQRKVIDAGLDAVMLVEELNTREEALESLCEGFMLAHQSLLEQAAYDRRHPEAKGATA